MVQLVKCPTLDFGSGHDLMVHEFEPHVRLCANSGESAWDSLSPVSPSLRPPSKINFFLKKETYTVT